MVIGGSLLLPTMWGILFSLLVGGSILKGLLSFNNLPGIVLVNFGLLAVLFSSKNDFPLKFKLGYCMLSLAPLVDFIAGKTLFFPGTDSAHTVTAAWILVTTILQRSSMLERG